MEVEESNWDSDDDSWKTYWAKDFIYDWKIWKDDFKVWWKLGKSDFVFPWRWDNERPWDHWSWYEDYNPEEENPEDWWIDEYPWVEWTPVDDDNAWDDYYPWVEWRPTKNQEENIPDWITDFSRWGLLNWEWIYPENLELRFVPKTAISFVKNFFEKRTPTKRAKLYSQIIIMLENYENNAKLKIKKEKLIRILKDLRDIMVVYRLR